MVVILARVVASASDITGVRSAVEGARSVEAF